MKTRAAFFDLGNTLVAYYQRHEFPDVLDECLNRVLAAVGLDGSHIDHAALRHHALLLNKERDDLRVRPLEERLAVLLAPYAETEGSAIARACTAFLEPIFERARVDPLARYVLRALKARGLKTAIISNTPWGSPAKPWHTELERHGLAELVDAVVFCVDVGWRKPHPAPFAAALEQLSVLPKDCVFVGDDPRWDVVGAERSGLRPILLTTDGSTPAGHTVIHALGELPTLLSLVQQC